MIRNGSADYTIYELYDNKITVRYDLFHRRTYTETLGRSNLSLPPHQTKYAHDGIITLFAMYSISIMVISRRATEHPKYSLIVVVVVIIIMVIGNIYICTRTLFYGDLRRRRRC